MSKHLKHNSKLAKKPVNKKLIIIIVCACVLVAGGVTAFLIFLFSSNPTILHPNLPNDEKIKSDMGVDKTVTIVKVNKKPYTFKISEFEKTDYKVKPNADNPKTFEAWVKISRSSEPYGIKPVEYKVTYKNIKSKLKYDSSEVVKGKVVLTPLKGVDKNEAVKKVKKTYKKAVFKDQKTDLKKGVDKLTYKIDDNEFEGTATAIYKFDNKKGWLFKKVDDKKVKFKKGVTHKEKGLYTNSNVKNIMFLGIDAFDNNGRSDVMMLISVDSNTGKIKQTSFMRDNWFNIPGYGENKLNAAYVFGGAPLTVSTISNTFGIKIDNYVSCNFSTFRNLINQIGGIDVNITSDEAGYINWQINKNGQASSVGTISTKGGVTHLNGQQALWLCRDRGDLEHGFSGDDFKRTGRQRRVIQALVNTYKTYTPEKVLATLNALKGNVKTDMTMSDFKWFAERSPKFFTYKFQERCVPDDGEWQSGTGTGGAWIIDIKDFDGLKSQIQKDIYEDLK